MSKSTDIRIKDIQATTQQIDYRTPIKFGGRVVNDVVLYEVNVVVESRDGQTAKGFGSMPVGNVWAWPSDSVDGATTLDAMIHFGNEYVTHVGGCREVADPVALTHELAKSQDAIAAKVCQQLMTRCQSWRSWLRPAPSRQPFTTLSVGCWASTATTR